MGHRTLAMQMGTEPYSFARGPVMKRKPRLKWRNRKWRFQDAQFQRRGDLLIRRYFGNDPPEAPRNTTSYIIRSKLLGDAMVPVVTPSPFTPVVLPTPGPLPRYKEQFSEEARKWGLDGYGSMSGLIRMKARDMEAGALGIGEVKDVKAVEEEGKGENYGQYVESLEQVEQRMDHGLDRFEIFYPYTTDNTPKPPLQVVLVDQEHHIAHLEEENISLKERLSLIERELGDLRRRIHMLEARSDHRDSGEVVSEKSIS